MKRIRCPKCDEPILFDDSQYEAGRSLVFACPACNKQFRIRTAASRTEAKEEEETPVAGYLSVIENTFHFKQSIPLRPGENVVGRYVRGTTANAAVRTVDPSMDTTHCVISVTTDKQGRWKFLLRDAPSNTGTFLMNTLLGPKERALMEDGAVLTLGATTMIFHTGSPDEAENPKA